MTFSCSGGIKRLSVTLNPADIHTSAPEQLLDRPTFTSVGLYSYIHATSYVYLLFMSESAGPLGEPNRTVMDRACSMAAALLADCAASNADMKKQFISLKLTDHKEVHISNSARGANVRKSP